MGSFGITGGFDDGEKDKLEWIGIGANGLIALLSFILVILGGVYSGSGSWTSVAILLLGLMLMGASILITVGLFLQSKLTGLLVFIGKMFLVHKTMKFFFKFD